METMLDWTGVVVIPIDDDDEGTETNRPVSYPEFWMKPRVPEL
jgi:hypothetical protein